MLTTGRAEGEAEFGSAARKDAVEVPEVVAVAEAVEEAEAVVVAAALVDAGAVALRLGETFALPLAVHEPLPLREPEVEDVALSVGDMVAEEVAVDDHVDPALELGVVLGESVGTGEHEGAMPPAHAHVPSAALRAITAVGAA